MKKPFKFILATLSLATMLGTVRPAQAGSIVIAAFNFSDTPNAFLVLNGYSFYPYGAVQYLDNTTGVCYWTYDTFTPPSGIAPITIFEMQPNGTYIVALEGSGTAPAGSPNSLRVVVIQGN